MELLKVESDLLDSKLSAPTKIAIQFFQGAACGLAVVIAFLLHFWFFSAGITTVQIVMSVLFVATCGVLSAMWGTKALAWLLKMVESTPV
jgi:hypothetical protein